MTAKYYVRLAGIAFLAFLTSCSSGPKVRVDRDSHTDFASYKTFSWLDPIENKRTSTLVGDRVKGAIVGAMQSKGYKLTDSQSDFRVSYVLNVYERPKQSGVRLGVGAGGSSGNVGGGVGLSIPLGKRTEIAGAMTIDIIDGKRNAQVWTGSYETVVSKLDLTDTDANSLVATILAKYP